MGSLAGHQGKHARSLGGFPAAPGTRRCGRAGPGRGRGRGGRETPSPSSPGQSITQAPAGGGDRQPWARLLHGAAETCPHLLGLTFHLCSGENDAVLEWPVENRQVIMTILDQEADVRKRMSSSMVFTTSKTQTSTGRWLEELPLHLEGPTDTVPICVSLGPPLFLV